MVRHTTALNCLNIIRLNDFAWLVLYADSLSVEVSQDEIDSCQSLEETNFFLDEKVSTSALEGGVCLLLDLNDNITGLNSGIFVSLTVEYVFLSVRSTLIDLDLDDLLFLDDLLSIASLALIFLVDDLALAITVIARSGALRVHAGT